MEETGHCPSSRPSTRHHAKVLDPHDWDTVFLSNHDNPRIVSSFGDDSPEFRSPSAKLLETMLLTLRGTPFIYQGDELGMTNYPFQSIDEFNDIEAQATDTSSTFKPATSPARRITSPTSRHMSRDNARTPMQWDNSPNGGFTTAAKAWLAVNPNYTEINAAQETADPDSVYNYTRR